MDKLTFKEWSTLSDIQTITTLKEDEEFSMARGELKTAKSAIERLMRHLKGEGNLEAWVQSKITKASEYLDTVADHMEGGEDETEDFKEEFKKHKSVEKIAKKHKVSPSIIEKQLEMGIKVEKEHTTSNQLAKEIALQHLDEVPDYYSKLRKVEKVQEMISTSAMTGKPYRDISNKRDQKDLEKERSKRKKEKEEKYKKSLESLRDQTREKGIRFYDKKGSGYIKDGQKQYDESIELHDANGNLFAHVVDIIRGSDYKFKSFTHSINEDAVEELEDKLKKLNNTSYDSIDKLMRNIMKEHGMTAKELHNAFVKKHDKTPDEWINNLNEKCWDGYKQVGMKKKGKNVVPNCVKEETKSGDSSLRDWFAKSRASDGTPGWVQLGGKYAGKPCAKQPGQTTKPKCGSSKMKSNLSDKEEESAFRRKNQEDPNPDRKGKAKMVATEEKDACYSKVKSRYSVWPSAYASGALVKCRKVGAKNWGNKSESVDTNALTYDWDYPISENNKRYCPKCKKNETRDECKYGVKYWDMFSINSALSSDAYDPNDVHPANEGVSFEIGSGHKQAQKQTKIRNLATGTTNPNEKSAALGKLSGPSLPLADCVIQPGQLTTEDYQRIQSTGNVYTILFSWRGRRMMNIQLFFPSMNRPSKEEVTTQIEKLYPGAIIMQWQPSPTDPSKPIVVIQK